MGDSGTATGGGVETVTIPGAPSAAAPAPGALPVAGSVVGTLGVTAPLGGTAAPEVVDVGGFGPIGTVPAEVEGIWDRGIPEIGEMSGSTGRTVTPGGSVPVFVAPGAVGETAPGLLSGDWLPIVGDVLGVPGAAVVPEGDVAVDELAAELPLVPALPVPLPEPLELPPVWASATAAPKALPTMQALKRNFVFMVPPKKFYLRGDRPKQKTFVPAAETPSSGARCRA